MMQLGQAGRELLGEGVGGVTSKERLCHPLLGEFSAAPKAAEPHQVHVVDLSRRHAARQRVGANDNET